MSGLVEAATQTDGERPYFLAFVPIWGQNSRMQSYSVGRQLPHLYLVPPSEATVAAPRLRAPQVLSEAVPCSIETARQISALFRDAYGDKYHRTVTNNPEWIQEEINSDRWIACIVADSTNTVVAHGALLNNGGNLRLARVLVAESARGLGLASIITSAMLEEADRRGRAGIVSPVITESVTTHCGTQKIFAENDFKPLGLLVSKFADYFGVGHRESVLLMGRAVSSGVDAIYVPSSMAPVAKEILGWHQLLTDVRDEASACGRTWHCEGRSSTTATFDAHMSILRVAIAGTPNLEDYRAKRAEGEQLSPEFTELKIEVASPSGCAVALEAQRDGFVFGGIEPHAEGVWLILQKSTHDVAERALALSLASREAEYIREALSKKLAS